MKHVKTPAFFILFFLLANISEGNYGNVLQAKKTGNLINFLTAEPKLLERKMYLLGQKNVVQPPEKHILLV